MFSLSVLEPLRPRGPRAQGPGRCTYVCRCVALSRRIVTLNVAHSDYIRSYGLHAPRSVTIRQTIPEGAEVGKDGPVEVAELTVDIAQYCPDYVAATTKSTDKCVPHTNSGNDLFVRVLSAAYQRACTQDFATVRDVYCVCARLGNCCCTSAYASLCLLPM